MNNGVESAAQFSEALDDILREPVANLDKYCAFCLSIYAGN